jgi:hypothetical protein
MCHSCYYWQRAAARAAPDGDTWRVPDYVVALPSSLIPGAKDNMPAIGMYVRASEASCTSRPDHIPPTTASASSAYGRRTRGACLARFSR